VLSLRELSTASGVSFKGYRLIPVTTVRRSRELLLGEDGSSNDGRESREHLPIMQVFPELDNGLHCSIE